jgi:hypothetical protein
LRPLYSSETGTGYFGEPIFEIHYLNVLENTKKVLMLRQFFLKEID